MPLTMKIPLYRPQLDIEDEAVALKVIRSGKLSRGDQVEKFEEEFAKYMGKSHAIMVNSGTSGLHLGIKSLGWKQGDEVITTPYSFVATSNVLLHEGIKPIFVDIDQKTLNINVQKIPQKINSKTKGILPVHIWGLLADMGQIKKLKEEHGLQVLEDSCQAIGRPSKSFPVAQVGDVTVFSFFESKQMTSAGEGGVIVTDNRMVGNLCRSLRDQGRSSEKNWLDHVRLGYNYRMTEIQAAVGRVQLKKLQKMLIQRTKLADLYTKLLKKFDSMETPFESDRYRRSWFLYFVVFKNQALRDKVQRRLLNKGIECKTYFPPITSYREFKKRGYSINACPVAQNIYKRSLALPLFPSLKPEEVEYIVKEIDLSVK